MPIEPDALPAELASHQETGYWECAAGSVSFLAHDHGHTFIQNRYLEVELHNHNFLKFVIFTYCQIAILISTSLVISEIK